MKLERLLKVPLSSRTIELVINIPDHPVSPTPTAAAPKPSGRARAWAVLKIAGPTTASLAALVISVLALLGQTSANREQQQANTAAQQANAVASAAGQRHAAGQVSFLQGAVSSPPFTSLLVENRGVTPIYEVTFQIQAGIYVGKATLKQSNQDYIKALVGGGNYVQKAFTLYLGDVPACSSATLDVASSVTAVILRDTKITKGQLGKSPVGVLVGSMSFADSSGSDWQYSGVGELNHLGNLPENDFSADGYLATNWNNASGCS